MGIIFCVCVCACLIVSILFFSMKQLQSRWIDLQALYAIWFSTTMSVGASHKERLESHYGAQVNSYDHFRPRFLHGREPMLRACARHTKETENFAAAAAVWVDLGGGTAENVCLMSQYMDVSSFEKIYVVDLCGPMCDLARRKANALGWNNVEIVEADVCDFEPKMKPATLITFSYSLSMIPSFMDAIDKALSYLDPNVGILGVTDLCTSLKHDIPARQNSFYCRWFWRIMFDRNDVNLGPARRQYLDHLLEQVYEENMSGGMPCVPFLKIPHYVWLGKKRIRRPQTLANGDTFDHLQ